MKFILVKHKGRQWISSQIEVDGIPETETVAAFHPGTDWEYMDAIVALLNKHKDELEK